MSAFSEAVDEVYGALARPAEADGLAQGRKIAAALRRPDAVFVLAGVALRLQEADGERTLPKGGELASVVRRLTPPSAALLEDAMDLGFRGVKTLESCARVARTGEGKSQVELVAKMLSAGKAWLTPGQLGFSSEADGRDAVRTANEALTGWLKAQGRGGATIEVDEALEVAVAKFGAEAARPESRAARRAIAGAVFAASLGESLARGLPIEGSDRAAAPEARISPTRRQVRRFLEAEKALSQAVASGSRSRVTAAADDILRFHGLDGSRAASAMARSAAVLPLVSKMGKLRVVVGAMDVEVARALRGPGEERPVKASATARMLAHNADAVVSWTGARRGLDFIRLRPGGLGIAEFNVERLVENAETTRNLRAFYLALRGSVWESRERLVAIRARRFERDLRVR